VRLKSLTHMTHYDNPHTTSPEIEYHDRPRHRMLLSYHRGTVFRVAYQKQLFSGRWVNHRIGAPAYLVRYSRPSGAAMNIQWFRSGLLHREDGPADILVTPDGSVYSQWYLKGSHIRKETHEP